MTNLRSKVLVRACAFVAVLIGAITLDVSSISGASISWLDEAWGVTDAPGAIAGQVAPKDGKTGKDKSPKATILDKSKIYFGKPNKVTKPAVVARKKVYDKIPAYKKIKQEKLKPTDARYHFLVREASEKFKKAVKKVAKAKGYDLVAEKNAILVPGKILPDITKDVIKKIQSTP